MRKFQKEKNYYKNNRGSFWELENRIMGRKKRIMCGCPHAGGGRETIIQFVVALSLLRFMFDVIINTIIIIMM